ncbi:MAG: hypothetical protein AAF572_15005 [Cyanobacteria bacterium P01_B01_bin.77]
MPSSNHPLPDDLQRQIRAGRKFNLSEAIGREGGSFLRGSQAMVPRPLRALAAINGAIDQHLVDPQGALQPCLKRWIKTDGRIGKYLNEPLTALQVIVLDIMENPPILYEFARQVAVECGQLNGERPYFQKPGIEASPDAPYSYKSIQEILAELLYRVAQAPPPT